MADLSLRTAFYKRISPAHVAFVCISLLMLFTRFACLYTYNGADDLHLAFLSSRMLNGSYDMFFANDIFSARLLPIAYQAAWFKLFGINDLSVSMPSLSLLIILAYFVCFKCGLHKSIHTAVLGSSLIYFNPVVVTATSGNLADVYIALIAVVLFYLFRKNMEVRSKQQYAVAGAFAGLLLFAGLFVKESIILVYVAAAIMLFVYRHKISRSFLIPLLAVFCMADAGYLAICYAHTGNAFFHLQQIKNSLYFNPCSYDCLPPSVLLKRLTVTVPINAMVMGAYPLLLLIPALLVFKQQKNVDSRFWKMLLVSLLLLALYFPFSLFPYVPLCHDMRQFFFLFPFAAIVYLQRMSGHQEGFRSAYILSTIVFGAATLLTFVYSPFNKWLILCYSLLTCLFAINILLNKKWQQGVLYFLVPAVFWLSIVYPLYKKPHNGYATLKKAAAALKQDTSGTKSFYFLNNDTRSHFALINKFDTANEFINLDTTQLGFKPFIAYQRQPLLHNAGGFKKGWLVVSKDYPENIGAAGMGSVNKLLSQVQPRFWYDNVSVYYLDSAEMATALIKIVNMNTGTGGCY